LARRSSACHGPEGHGRSQRYTCLGRNFGHAPPAPSLNGLAGEPGNEPAYDGGPEFVLTHEPPDPPDPAVTFLTGDIGEAVATARSAAGGKNLEILGADVTGQCLRRGLVDEILVYVLPVLPGDGIRFFSSPGLARIDLEPVSVTPSGTVTILRFRVRE
jgi:dihydrofolate reductase